jgi:hypothetical protein
VRAAAVRGVQARDSATVMMPKRSR